MSMSKANAGSGRATSWNRATWGLRGMTFGPVPSRRLGRSLGINNIPPKICTYSCAYCQVGRTVQMRTERTTFYGAAAVISHVRTRVDEARRANEHIDHLTFVPDGEPTLDVGLGCAIRGLRPLGIPVAVITNGSLISNPEVRSALCEADRVSLKVDAVDESTWRRINRPHRRLQLHAILEGLREFAASFRGVLTTETMLLDGINDGPDELVRTADFVSSLAPSTAYLSVPTRPPASAWARPPCETSLARAYGIFAERQVGVEMLLGYEGDAFASTGDPVEDLLSITAVHPMREAAVRRLLSGRHVPWVIVQHLLDDGRLVQVLHDRHRYFLRPVRGQLDTGHPLQHP